MKIKLQNYSKVKEQRKTTESLIYFSCRRYLPDWDILTCRSEKKSPFFLRNFTVSKIIIVICWKINRGSLQWNHEFVT